eukprot:5895247-Pyramimonas_sp.AAC.1
MRATLGHGGPQTTPLNGRGARGGLGPHEVTKCAPGVAAHGLECEGRQVRITWVAAIAFLKGKRVTLRAKASAGCSPVAPEHGVHPEAEATA